MTVLCCHDVIKAFHTGLMEEKHPTSVKAVFATEHPSNKSDKRKTIELKNWQPTDGEGSAYAEGQRLPVVHRVPASSCFRARAV